MWRLHTRVLLAIICAVSLIGALGCRQVAEKAVEGATGVKVEDGGGSVTVKTDEGEATIKSGKELPEGFPTDVPVYKGIIETSSSFASNEGQVYNVVLSTEDEVEAVKQFYLDELAAKGWKVGMTLDSGSGAQRGVTISAEQGDLALTVVASVRAEGGTEVSLMVASKQ